MTVGLIERPSASRWLVFSIRVLCGLLVLLPAFLVWMQFAFLDNVARSEGRAGNWESYSSGQHRLPICFWRLGIYEAIIFGARRIPDSLLWLHSRHPGIYFFRQFSAPTELVRTD